jgi:hypothetical protein
VDTAIAAATATRYEEVVYRLTDGRGAIPTRVSVLRVWRRDYIVVGEAMTFALLDSSVVEPDPGFSGTIVLQPGDDVLDALHFDSTLDKHRPKR